VSSSCRVETSAGSGAKWSLTASTAISPAPRPASRPARLMAESESHQAQEPGIVGETPNLAARLQGIAAANTVVIAEGDSAASRRPL
jgi:hypothetical protein